jgi:hypothetical protein
MQKDEIFIVTLRDSTPERKQMVSTLPFSYSGNVTILKASSSVLKKFKIGADIQ